MSATAVCQSARPAYEGQLRKRPLAILNEGSSAAFVSCFLPNQANDGVLQITVTAMNRSAVNTQATCTLSEGQSTIWDDSIKITKNIPVEANGGLLAVDWSYFDNGGTNFYRAGLSCLLPPGVELGEIRTYWFEDIGQ